MDSVARKTRLWKEPRITASHGLSTNCTRHHMGCIYQHSFTRDEGAVLPGMMLSAELRLPRTLYLLLSIPLNEALPCVP